MKKTLLTAALLLGAGSLFAQDYTEYFRVYGGADKTEIPNGATVYVNDIEDLTEDMGMPWFTFEKLVMLQSTSMDAVPFTGYLALSDEISSADYATGVYGLAQLCAYTAPSYEEALKGGMGNCFNGNADYIGVTYGAVIPASDKGVYVYQLHDNFYGTTPAADLNAKFKVITKVDENPSIQHVFYVVFNMDKSQVNELTVESGAKEYYNLQGVKVNAPRKGLYIVRQGGKTWKQVIK